MKKDDEGGGEDEGENEDEGGEDIKKKSIEIIETYSPNVLVP